MITYSKDENIMNLQGIQIGLDEDTILIRAKILAKIGRMLKRCIDLCAGIVGTILLVPLTVMVWSMKKMRKDNSPVFYKQLRIGKDGKSFKIYKFGSMVKDADKRLEEYLEENIEEAMLYEKYKKLENDPRITKTGKFLRETSLDEWPQFLNLLRRKYEFSWTKTIFTKRKRRNGRILRNNHQSKTRFNRTLANYWKIECDFPRPFENG